MTQPDINKLGEWIANVIAQSAAIGVTEAHADVVERLKKLSLEQPTHRGLREGVQALIEELEQ